MAKSREKIFATSGIKIKKEGLDGFGGSVYPVEFKNGKTKIITDSRRVLNFIFSTRMWV